MSHFFTYLLALFLVASVDGETVRGRQLASDSCYYSFSLISQPGFQGDISFYAGDQWICDDYGGCTGTVNIPCSEEIVAKNLHADEAAEISNFGFIMVSKPSDEVYAEFDGTCNEQFVHISVPPMEDVRISLFNTTLDCEGMGYL